MRVFPNAERVQPAGETNYRPEHLYCKTYGRSLLSGYVDSYVPDVVLQGVPQMNFTHLWVEDLKRTVVVSGSDFATTTFNKLTPNNQNKAQHIGRTHPEISMYNWRHK